MRLQMLGAATAAILLACSACTASPVTGRTPTPSVAAPAVPPGAGAAPRSPAAPDGAVTKLLVLVVENHSLEEMRARMPYTFGLAQSYGYATDYTAIRHPSLPNYIAITSGDTHAVTDDAAPAAHPLDGESVFGQALRSGRTAGVYADGMTGTCSTVDGGDRYAVKHNPWAYYVSERASCAAGDQPVTALGPAARDGRLPNAGMVVPNLCHDAHDCSLGVADDWIRAELGTVLAGPDWRSGHLAVVITADEDDRSSDNRVLTVVVHPSQHGNVVTDRLDHYSLSGLYSDVLHAPGLGHAPSAGSMAKAFGLPLL
jgi:acid phosphatase